MTDMIHSSNPATVMAALDTLDMGIQAVAGA